MWRQGGGHLEDLKRPGEEECKKNLQEELASLKLQEEQAQNRDQWKRVINRLTS